MRVFLMPVGSALDDKTADVFLYVLLSNMYAAGPEQSSSQLLQVLYLLPLVFHWPNVPTCKAAISSLQRLWLVGREPQSAHVRVW